MKTALGLLVLAELALLGSAGELPGSAQQRNSRELLRQSSPFVGSYWESYLAFPNEPDTCADLNVVYDVDESDYGVFLKDAPLGDGLDVVNIAFADMRGEDRIHLCPGYNCDPFVCGLHLFHIAGLDDDRYEELKRDIADLKAAGAIVKLAFGGEEYGNLGYGGDLGVFVFESTVERMVGYVQELDLDGVELVNTDSCGYLYMECDDQTSTHLYMLAALRKAMPDKIIGYTFPSSWDFPFRDVAQFGHDLVDTITFYRAEQQHIDEALAVGVPKSKIAWGLAVGCNGARYDDVTLEDAVAVASLVKSEGYAGVTTWSINRDTDHRVGPPGVCEELQTGQPDGSYIREIADILG